ncbi:MAG: hypothetical protein OHK93_006788 [Ramalina farinacea]|uniref:Heterokaryon incompatibility domain-containing protein n=1 Tax=Ramalina farinacea TaxID=258253 RepID=A0AA43TTF4_9LECA|nr:hypothetical protein [Ramalina farinacea]
MAEMPHFPASKPASAFKITGACETVLAHYGGDIQNIWLDTVCIDQKNPHELSASINSMYRWYKQAEVCFALLGDYPGPGVRVFTDSRWFTRGWTLQELVAPRNVRFFDRNWKYVGDKESLAEALIARTKIGRDFLLGRSNIGRASVSQRMGWYAGRITTVEEDAAYCLLGLFGVNLPLLYGEGKERAYRRLQEEIMRYSDDHSLFVWKSSEPLKQGSGLLADDPKYFSGTGDYVHKGSRLNNRPYQMTNKGISIDLYLQEHQGVYVASLDCPHGSNHYVGIYLECLSSETQQYRRTKTNELCKIVESGRGQLRSIFVKPLDEV